MRALVVYESMFGNTQEVANAITAGVGSRMQVDVVEVGAAPAGLSDDVALLVVGGPTHAFGMSRPRTREDAARQAGEPVVSAGIGLREWLEAVCGAGTVAAATFDTRIDTRLSGSAARRAEKVLRRRGFRIAAPAESFFVAGKPVRLVAGEAERARRWGEQLAATAGHAVPA